MLFFDPHFGGAFKGTPVGHHIQVVPINHPDADMVTNGEWATTSVVHAYDETTGHIETANTLYVPATSTVEGVEAKAA